MPIAPLITVVTVTIAAMAAVTAQRGALLPYGRSGFSFKNIVSNHRPPSSGQRCRTGERWEHPCRVCECTAKGSLRCEALPCSTTGKNPLVVDGMVIPPHMTMRDSGVFMNHEFHLKTGESAEEMYKTLVPATVESSDDIAKDSATSSVSQEDEDIPLEEIGDYLNSDMSSFAENSDEPDLNHQRSPPVHLLPDPDLDVVCNYWLQNNKLQIRIGGDYNFDKGKTPSAEYSGEVGYRTYQHQQRSPPVPLLPEPTVEEICRKWLETQSSRGYNDLPRDAAFLQILQAANAGTSPTLPPHSPPRYYNKDQPHPLLGDNHQAFRSPLLQSHMPSFYPPYHPMSYNSYPQFRNPPPCCGFDFDAPPPSYLLMHRSPGAELGHFRLPPTPPQPLHPFTAPSPTPSVGAPPPPAPAPAPPPSTACDEDPPKAVAREVRDLHPEILDLNNANHFKMHPNAVSVPVRRRRSAADD